MSPPAASNRPSPERIAAALVGLLFLLSLVSRTILWDWLFDTAYLLAAVYVALGRTRTEGLPLLCCYLFLDSALQALAGLFFPGMLPLVYLLLTGLYGAALRRRLAERGIAGGTLPWRGLFERPAIRLTLATLVPLVCLYLPMLHFYYAQMMTSPPMVVTVGYVTTMSPARVMDVGGEVTYRGVQVAFGRAAGLLLAAIGTAHLFRLGGLAQGPASLRLMRIAAAGVGAWWLVAGRGYRSLDNPYDLIFIAGYGFLLAMLFATLPGAGPTGSTRE